MKSLASVLFTCLFTATILSHAQEARYSYRTVKCYVVLTNASVFTAYNFGIVRGLSNYSCENAWENLQELCDAHAREIGQVSGSLYLDVLILSKESSRQQSSNTGIGISDSKYGPAGVFGKRSSTSVSLGYSQNAYQKTDVQYVPANEERDCKLNNRIPRDSTPMTQDPRYGG